MENVAIIGVGLIGASFGLALRRAGFSGDIAGVSSPGAIRAALHAGAISRECSLHEAARSADLIYLAQAESGFQPLALSRAGARGMWQFMASRASMYGLERNWWVDDRQDPVKSTHAAA